MDETYIRVRGRWTYLYRAVDKRGLTVDFLLSEHRDIATAKRFFARAIEQHSAPEGITLDGYPATHAAVAELKEGGELPFEMWISKHLNNIVGQEHRRVKQRIYPMLGFKKPANGATTLSGVELVQKIKKGQFNISNLASGVEVRMPQTWETVPTA